MLQLRDTRVVTSKHMPVVSGASIPEEGMALVYAKEAGVTKVQPSTGAAGEIFAGVSLSRNSAPAMLPNVESGVVPANGRVTLARTPLPGQISAVVAGGFQTVAGTADADNFSIAGEVVQFHTSHAGAAYSVQYIYAPTVIEARSIKGDAPPGGLASAALGVVGLLQQCIFATNYFDASQDWSDAMYAKVGPNGSFVPADAATGIKNVVVQNTPTSADPYLALSINVA